MLRLKGFRGLGLRVSGFRGSVLRFRGLGFRGCGAWRLSVKV